MKRALFKKHTTKWCNYCDFTKNCFCDLWRMIVDVDCYSTKEYKKQIYVNAEQYNDIKNKGYYMA